MAAGSTYTPIATTTLGSNQATVEFTGISGSYTDLLIVVNSYSTTAAGIYAQVGNGSYDTGTNYSYTYLIGNGTAASSGRASTQASIYLADQSSTAGNRQTTILQFNNYSNTTTNKTVLSRGSSSSQSAGAVIGLWRSTAAINRIRLLNGNFAATSTFTLYGIAAA
jgi:hypothetical protein